MKDTSKQATSKRVDNIVDAILADYDDDRVINKTDVYNQPDKDAIIDIINKMMVVLYPGYYSDKVYRIYSIKNMVAATIEDVIYNLSKQIVNVFKYRNTYNGASHDELTETAYNMTYSFMEKVPYIREMLDTDVQAAFEGDPAAGSMDEIIFSYPGLYAISVYRMAHELTLIGVPMIPRIMTEHAHSVTGIDIHPGAKIGKYFFMDHGTGIVIGETSVIGEHVKLYQGVTLGGLSTKGGQKLKGVKRHPTIGDNATIYSGASILGGDTQIGENVVVGGNTFVTKSIEKDSRVTAKEQELQIKNKK